MGSDVEGASNLPECIFNSFSLKAMKYLKKYPYRTSIPTYSFA